MNRLTDVVKNLILINVVFFVGQMALANVIDVTQGYSHFPLSRYFKPFQIITSMFMHADVGHLLMNMSGLFFLGPMVESALGAKRFLIMYLIAGLAGTFLHYGVDYFTFASIKDQIDPSVLSEILEKGREAMLLPSQWTNQVKELHGAVNTPSLGASGAVYGVVIAFATMFPKMKLMIIPIPVPVPAFVIGIVYVGGSLLGGVGQFQGDNIAHFAHLGGAIAGFIMIHFWKMANLRS